MDEILKQLWEETIAELRREAEAVGTELGEAVEDAAAYAVERTKHLSLVIGEPGFAEALMVERDNIALFASLRAVERGEELDTSMKRSLTVALKFASGLISLIV